MNKPYIIVVGGVSGSGKTTVSKHLSSKLGNAKAIFFDDYDFDGPSNIIDWVERGADYDEWDLDLLLKDLEVFRSDSVRYIVIDFPFAYQHAQIKEWINFAVFIDTPLDIAYARRLVRDFQDSTAKKISYWMQRTIFQLEEMATWKCYNPSNLHQTSLLMEHYLYQRLLI